MCNIYKMFDIYESPINYALGGRNVKYFNDRMLPHVPIKHARGQNNVFPSHTTFEVLL